MRESFLQICATVAVVGAVLPALGAIAGGESLEYVGSMVVSSAAAVTFAGFGWYALRAGETGTFAAAVVATALGLWFIHAPSIYEPGVVGKGSAHAGGALLAVFAAFLGLERVEGALLD